MEIEVQTSRQPSNVDIDNEKIIASQDVDLALVFLRENASNVNQFVEINEKKLIRKVDWMLTPLMFACYYLQYTDKTLSEDLRTTLS